MLMLMVTAVVPEAETKIKAVKTRIRMEAQLKGWCGLLRERTYKAVV